MNDSHPARVLIADDEPAVRSLLHEAVSAGGYDAVTVDGGPAALAALAAAPATVLLADLVMPGMDGLQLVHEAATRDPNLVSIVVSGNGTIKTAVDAMRAGAFDFIEKPIDVPSLLAVLARAVAVRKLRDETVALRETVLVYELAQTIVHELDPQRVLDQVVGCAATEFAADEATIMVFGPDGTLTVAATRDTARAHLVGEPVDLNAGPVAWAARHRQPLLLSGPVHSPNLAPRYLRPEVRSAMICPLVTGETLVGVLVVATTVAGKQFTPGQLKTLSILGGIAAGAIATATKHSQAQAAEAAKRQALEQLRDALVGTIATMAAAAEMRDAYTAGHERRVADLAGAIGTELGLGDEQVEGIRLGGLVHDIGKLGVPTEILVCPRRLTEIEMSLVRTHAQGGYEILRPVAFPWPIAAMVYQHHERLDGTGYPLALRGEQIGLEARILAVADVVESISSHRPYRPALGVEAALDEVGRHAGTLYDPDVVRACTALIGAGQWSGA